MIIKVTLGRWRFTFSMAPTTKVVGVDSTLKDGNHILMWDFDGHTFDEVVCNLLKVLRRYKLPKIHICETNKDKKYHAVCFKRTPWRKAVEIICATEGVDYNFIKYGIYRNHFTLRISPKCGREIRFAGTIGGIYPEDVSIEELNSFVHYETLEDGWHSRKLEVRLKPVTLNRTTLGEVVQP
jgi:hypothetical protein